jgi:hypothetical protein
MYVFCGRPPPAGQEDTAREWASAGPTLVTTEVCLECNNEWLARIGDRAMPPLSENKLRAAATLTHAYSTHGGAFSRGGCSTQGECSEDYLGAPGYSEDVGVGWEERGSAEHEALACLDPKPGLLDVNGCVAREMASTGDAGPDSRIGESLQARLPLGVGGDMLVKAQLATGTYNSIKLCQGLPWVGESTKHKRRNTGIEGVLFVKEVVRIAVDDSYVDRRRRCCVLGASA